MHVVEQRGAVHRRTSRLGFSSAIVDRVPHRLPASPRAPRAGRWCSPRSSQSETSCLGSSAGKATTATEAATPSRLLRTCSAWSRPAGSWSGMITTARSMKYLAKSAGHLPAPPGLVVASSPFSASRSASFSPSTIQIRPVPANHSLSRYGTNRTPFITPLPVMNLPVAGS